MISTFDKLSRYNQTVSLFNMSNHLEKKEYIDFIKELKVSNPINNDLLDMFREKETNFLRFHNPRVLENITLNTVSNEQEDVFRNRIISTINNHFMNSSRAVIFKVHPLLHNDKYLKRLDFILNRFQDKHILFNIQEFSKLDLLRLANRLDKNEFDEQYKKYSDLIYKMISFKKLMFVGYPLKLNPVKYSKEDRKHIDYKYNNKYVVFEKYLIQLKKDVLDTYCFLENNHFENKDFIEHFVTYGTNDEDFFIGFVHFSLFKDLISKKDYYNILSYFNKYEPFFYSLKNDKQFNYFLKEYYSCTEN